MRRYLLLISLLALPAAAAAQAQTVTVADIVALTRAGLGDEALIALIEVNRPVFPVDVDTLKTLKEAGVSPRVIVVMIRSGRTPPPDAAPLPVDTADVPPAEAQPLPPVIVVERNERIREVPVAVPVYIAVPTRRIDRRDVDGHRVKPVEPVYWGWGGKLRPDAWKPTAAELQKDAKVPREPQRK